MPIYMDLHIAPGVTPHQVAEAHLLDIKIQERYLCKAITYWHDENKGCVFCLIEAPDEQSVREMHKEAHGLIPNKIVAVNTDLVNAFLGRIRDPEDAARVPETGLKVFSDPAFRIILVIRPIDRRVLEHALGVQRARELLLLYTTVVRDQSRTCGGREASGRDDGFVISFREHTEALNCAQTIRKKLTDFIAPLGLQLALHAGVPVDKDNALFGATIRLVQSLCAFGNVGQVTISSVVRKLFKDNDWALFTDEGTRAISASEETFLESLLDALASGWHNPEFDVEDFCRMMSVSKSQLYRKCIALTGMSPNLVLREYRLLKALEMLRDDGRNISQTTFDTGFSSPSYFTKCFQKRFGMQPHTYVKMR